MAASGPLSAAVGTRTEQSTRSRTNAALGGGGRARMKNAAKGTPRGPSPPPLTPPQRPRCILHPHYHHVFSSSSCLFIIIIIIILGRRQRDSLSSSSSSSAAVSGTHYYHHPHSSSSSSSSVVGADALPSTWRSRLASVSQSYHIRIPIKGNYPQNTPKSA